MKSVIAVVVFLAGFLAQAADPKVTPIMDLMLADLTSLTPYIFSESKFMDAKNEKSIGLALDRIESRTQKALHENIFKTNPFAAINMEILSDHLHRTSRVYKTNKKFARYMVQASMQMCITCHTSGFNTRSFYQSNSAEVLKGLKTEAEKIEYLLTTRQFAEAEKKIDSAIEGYPKNKMTIFQIEDLLRSQATLYAIIQEDPARGHVRFTSIIKDKKKFPSTMMSNLALWSESFQKWSTQPKSSNSEPSEADLKKAKELMGYKPNEKTIRAPEENFVDRLRATKLLTRLIQSSASKDSQGEALFLLGLLYHSMNHQLFFDLDYAYLKKCMDMMPKAPVAKQCYESLKEIVVENSSGSSGIHMEPEDQHMLDMYKEKIFN